MRVPIKWFVAVLAIAAVASALGGAYAWSWLHRPLESLPVTASYDVPRGASVGLIARDLQQRGWLRHPQLWRAWVRLRGVAGNIKAGEYALQAGMSPDDLVQLFSSGEVVFHSITFVEGTTFDDMRSALAQHAEIEQRLPTLTADDFIRRLKLEHRDPEGLFFPDTYQYPKGTTDLEILNIAHERLQRELDAAWATRAVDLPFHTAYEALILASIVEKESALPSERPLIAGVFVERLARGMKLQTDPTVIYGLGSAYDGNIHKDDLLRDSPYNTYTRAGLPPTPICMPSAAALRAAVNPARSGALYFVATGRGDGSHYFSRTLDEHNSAVQRYLRTLRQ